MRSGSVHDLHIHFISLREEIMRLFTLTLVLYRLQSEVEGRSRCCRVPDDNVHFSYFSVVLVALDSYLIR